MIKNITTTLFTHFLLAFAIYEYGSNIRDKAKLIVLPFCLLFAKKSNLKRFIYKVNIKYRDNTARINFSSWSDLVAFKEVFIEKQYELNPKNPPEIIFDLGSHVGMSVLYFALCFPESKIYGFEPDPNNFGLLQQNTASHSQIKIFNKAISNVDGKKAFFHGNSSSITSSFKINHHRSGKKSFVETETLDKILKQLGLSGIDILKFDIEGSEEDILFEESILDKITLMVGEIHCDLTTKTKDEFEILFNNNFKYVSMRPIASQRYLIKASK